MNYKILLSLVVVGCLCGKVVAHDPIADNIVKLSGVSGNLIIEKVYADRGTQVIELSNVNSIFDVQSIKMKSIHGRSALFLPFKKWGGALFSIQIKKGTIHSIHRNHEGVYLAVDGRNHSVEAQIERDSEKRFLKVLRFPVEQQKKE